MRRLGILLLTLLLAELVGARTSFTGYSGSPTRQTCANSCHGGSNGNVTVTGFPQLYTPGTPYTITIARPSGNSIRQFNGSCRLGTGTANAGVLSGNQGTSTYSVTGETNGIRLSSNSQNSATFTWTAPAAGSGTARLYIGAYQGSNENGQSTELTLVSEEGEPGEPELALSGVTMLSDSDSDGVAEAGETVELALVLRNTGGVGINDIVGILSIDSPWAQMVSAQSDWPDLWPGGSATNEAVLSLVVSPGLPEDQAVQLTLQVDCSTGGLELIGTLDLVVPDPVLTLDWVGIVMDGDGDGIAEPGETCVLDLSLRNEGLQDVTAISGVLAPSSEWIEMGVNTAEWPLIGAGQSASPPVETPFTFTVAANAPAIFDEHFTLSLATGQGSMSLSFTLPVGVRDEIWVSELESDTESWSHAAAEGWGDEWHLSTEDAVSPSHAWKCGSSGDGNYQAHLDARLVTPELTLLPWSRLQFSHRIHAENSSATPDSAYDGGIVEISLDGGETWQQITPEGGYTHTFRHLTGSGEPTSHPFAGGTPCFSGNQAWTEVVYDLSSFGAVPVRFRFRFGSDDGTNREGWYIDNLSLIGLHQDTVVARPTSMPDTLELLPARPNPFNPTTTVSWVMPASGNARVELFDLQGSLVRVLANTVFAAGRQELRLDADNLASGTYLLRVEAAAGQRTQRLLLLK